jgi:hypothetical protein
LLPSNEAPDVRIKTPELPLNLQECPGILHRRLDFQTIPHNAFVLHQATYPFGIESGYVSGIEAGEGPTVSGTLLQYRQPVQSRLGAFENEHLKQEPVIMHRPSPLFVVICGQEWVTVCPGAPWSLLRQFRTLRERRIPRQLLSILSRNHVIHVNCSTVSGIEVHPTINLHLILPGVGSPGDAGKTEVTFPALSGIDSPEG